MQTAWSTTEVLLGCKRRVALRILSSVFKHPLHQHDKDQADLKHLKKTLQAVPQGFTKPVDLAALMALLQSHLSKQ